MNLFAFIADFVESIDLAIPKLRHEKRGDGWGGRIRTSDYLIQNQGA
ncbi:MAG TPA: hypothetical protein VMV09_04970 [Candidatus Saccharimonadales bacterium]|nr:hypothetical protein [Candidatus Saccharimonadales bacterium]